MSQRDSRALLTPTPTLSRYRSPKLITPELPPPTHLPSRTGCEPQKRNSVPPLPPTEQPEPFRMSDQSRRILRASVRRPHPGAAYSQRTRFAFMAERTAECTFSPAVNNMSVILDSIVHGGAGTASRVRLMEDKERRRQHRIASIRDQVDAQEVEGCTFHPQISRASREIYARGRGRSGGSPGNGVERIHAHADQMQRKRERRRRAIIEGEMAECTFQPAVRDDRGARAARDLAADAAERRRRADQQRRDWQAVRLLPSVYYAQAPIAGLQMPVLEMAALEKLPRTRQAVIMARLPPENIRGETRAENEYEYEYEYEYEEEYEYEYEYDEPTPAPASANATYTTVEDQDEGEDEGDYTEDENIAAPNLDAHPAPVGVALQLDVLINDDEDDFYADLPPAHFSPMTQPVALPQPAAAAAALPPAAQPVVADARAGPARARAPPERLRTAQPMPAPARTPSRGLVSTPAAPVTPAPAPALPSAPPAPAATPSYVPAPAPAAPAPAPSVLVLDSRADAPDSVWAVGSRAGRAPKSTSSAVAVGYRLPVAPPRPDDVDGLFSERPRRTLDEVNAILGL